MQLKAKLVILVAGVMLVSAVASGLVVRVAFQHKLLEEVQRQLDVATALAMQQLDTRILDWFRDLTYLSTDPVFRTRPVPSRDTRDIAEQLVLFRNNKPNYTALSFYGPDFVKLADTDGLGIGAPLEPAVRRDLPTTDSGVALRLSDESLGPRRAFELYRFVDGGLIAARVPVRWLHQIFSGVTGSLPEIVSVRIGLFDAQGRPIYTNEEWREQEGMRVVDDWFGAGSGLIGSEALSRLNDDSTEHPSVQWKLVMAVPEGELQDQLGQHPTLMIALLVVSVIALIALLSWFSFGLFRSLNRMAVAVADLEAGRLDKASEPPAQTGDEIDVVRRAVVEAGKKRQETEDALRQANEEMNDYMRIVSHDLKAPVRAIGMMAAWVEEDMPQEASEAVREHIDIIKRRAARLSRYLEDLLAYHRIGREASDPELTNVRSLMEHVVELAGLPAGFQVQLDGEALKFETIPGPLSNVVLNLISNAVKHHDREQGAIVVTWRREGSGLAVSVADDGPGIKSEYHEKIFQMFTTLLPRDQVEGSGMGLAFVRKTVEVFGGKVRVESGEGRGTRFHLTWQVEHDPPQAPDRLTIGD